MLTIDYGELKIKTVFWGDIILSFSFMISIEDKFISSIWKVDIDISFFASFISLYVWLAPNNNNGDRKRVTPLIYILTPAKTRDLLLPVG